MRISGLVDADFVNYRKISMFVGMPFCSFKCEKESGIECCQNAKLLNAKRYEISVDELVDRYTKCDVSEAVVFGGLEPMDSFDEVFPFISELRQYCDDDVVIYTGYYPHEIADELAALRNFKNIIVKFGRYQPGQKSHYDEVLGVDLASDNQWAERIS